MSEGALDADLRFLWKVYRRLGLVGVSSLGIGIVVVLCLVRRILVVVGVM